jgi:hypothetical protein
MKRSASLGITAVVLLVMAFVVYSSMARVRHECELCVEFNGVTRCARGAGADEAEARRGAQTAACGVLASGMDESIRCDNTPPTTVQCSTN